MGDFTYLNGINLQSKATLQSCPSGFSLPNDKTTVCQADGKWKAPVPHCGMRPTVY